MYRLKKETCLMYLRLRFNGRKKENLGGVSGQRARRRKNVQYVTFYWSTNAEKHTKLFIN